MKSKPLNHGFDVDPSGSFPLDKQPRSDFSRTSPGEERSLPSGSWSRAVLLFSLLLHFSVAGTATGQAWWQGAKQEADQLVPQFINTLPKALPAAVVVGLVSTGGVITLSYNSPTAQLPDGDSIFMIGSVQKLFGGLLFGQYLATGTVTLEQPAQTLLPKGIKMPVDPQHPKKAINLLQLADFTSGLPRFSDSLATAVHNCKTQPQVNQAVYQFLNSYHLHKEPGTCYEYSDISAPLLPNLLSTNLGNGQSYPALVQSMFLNELQMTNTGMFLKNGQPRLVRGYDAETGSIGTNPTDNRLSVTGYPEMHSTVNDLNRFVAANLGITQVSFSQAISNSLAPRFQVEPGKDNWSAFFWTVQTNNQVYSKDGLSPDYCYSSFVTFNRKTTNGVVILSNTTRGSAVSAMARKLLTTLSGMKPSPD